MDAVKVTCDRCLQEIGGAVGEGYTAGFYQVGAGIWSKYANPGEDVLCDRCMHNDPRYIADYHQPDEGERND